MQLYIPMAISCVDQQLIAKLLAFQAASPVPIWPIDFSGWVDSICKIIAALGLAGSGLWAAFEFVKNNRIKASELLLAHEKAYIDHALSTLLQIENSDEYEKLIKPALEKANKAHENRISKTTALATNYSKNENDTILAIERTLRHFAVSAFIASRKVDEGLMEVAYRYYLDIFDWPDRSDLAKYIKYFWPTVYKWMKRTRI